MTSTRGTDGSAPAANTSVDPMAAYDLGRGRSAVEDMERLTIATLTGGLR